MEYNAPVGSADPDDPYITGNPATDTAGSIPPAESIEQPQREIVNAIIAAGLTPDPADMTQLTQAIQAASAAPLPFSALDYPTIDTADNLINVIPASATNGGTVGFSADVLIALAKELVAGEKGIMKAVKTAVYTSADLDVSSTYYLRAKFVGGTWTVYTQKGTDTDPIPAGLMGTVDGATGGGFDSTVLDMLIARVVTGTAGTVPVVTEVANNKDLQVLATEEIDSANTGGYVDGTTITLDWARTPVIKGTSIYGFDSTAGLDATDVINLVRTRLKTGADRYSMTPEYDLLNTKVNSRVFINIFANAE